MTAERATADDEEMGRMVLEGLGLLGVKAVAAGYLAGLESRIADLERKVAALEGRRKR